MLRTAFKTIEEEKQSLEIEFSLQSQKLDDQSKEIGFLKERNLELYDRNNELEELASHQSTLQKVQVTSNQGGGKSDTAHMQEMMNAQMLLREEMKEKQLFKEQADETMKQLFSI